MHLEVRPEPTGNEREALLRALAVLDCAPSETSAWWEAGIRAAVEAGAEEFGAPSDESPNGLSSVG